MYSNDKYRVKVSISLDNGIYTLNNRSAIGKTWLCNVLKDFRRFGEPVIGYTYGDDRLGVNLVELYRVVQPSVLMLDRYDMYNGMFDEYLSEWSKNTIVLVDCKGILDVEDVKWCTIEMSLNRLEVVA